MRQSIWERDVEFPSFPKLEGQSEQASPCTNKGNVAGGA